MASKKGSNPVWLGANGSGGAPGSRRAAILINKAAQSGIELPYDAALYIAQRLRSNVRELKCLKRVIAHASFKRAAIDLELIKEALRDLFALPTSW